MLADDEDFTARYTLTEGARGIQSVRSRHTQVQEDYVRKQLACLLNGIRRIASLTNYVEARFGGEQAGNATPDLQVVIRNKDSHGRWLFGTRYTAFRKGSVSSSSCVAEFGSGIVTKTLVPAALESMSNVP